MLTIVGWNRADVEALVGDLSDYQKTKNHKRKQDPIPKPTRPRKQRTKLFYQILDKQASNTPKDTESRYTAKVLEKRV